MALTPGTRFGSYEVVEPIGSGGMGEVWRAKDTELKRDVAVKVLPASFAADADRLARFRREAEILASLNHTNIAQVYGLEKADDEMVIVMELVDGPTLADRIAGGPIPPDEALAIAHQIVNALEAAHEKQIVHRDLKPANVKLTGDGTVKVLDFGISKPIDPTAISGGNAVMTTPAVTQTGVIIGTAAYMSPEQARGRFVDQRTDIWAFGCLLFEMLTGQPAFGGEDVMLTLARVLDRATDLSSIPKTISPAVRHTLKLCLEKDPRRRIADIRDVRLALEGTFESDLPTLAEAQAAPSFWRRAGQPVSALALGAALAAVVAFVLWPAPEPKLVSRFEYSIPPGQTLQLPLGRRVALSPDGRRLVYNTTDGLYVRELDELDAMRIQGAENTPIAPSFYPDGEQLIYVEAAGNRSVRLSIAGGVPTAIVTAENGRAIPDAVTVNWMPNGNLLVSHRGGISELVPVDSMQPERLIDLGEGRWASGAELLPDGDTILFAVRDSQNGFENAQIVAQTISGGAAAEPVVIVPRGHDPRYLASGHLLFVLDGVVRAIAFDPDTLRTAGDSEPVLPDVATSLGTGQADYSVADDGTMAYIPGNSATPDALQAGLAWLTESGATEALPIDQPDDVMDARLSHDGRRLAVSGVFEGARDIYVFDNLTRAGGGRRITRSAGNDIRPIWTPDDERIIYFSLRDEGTGIYQRRANGQGEAELLWSRPDEYGTVWPNWVHPDGDRLVFAMQTPSGGVGIWQIELAPGAEPVALIDLPDVVEGYSALSPDGNWLAYGSNEAADSQEIYIVPFPDTGSDKIGPVSVGGGSEPFWSADGDALYYVDADRRIMRVEVAMEPEIAIGEPEWASNLRAPGGNARLPNYDFDPAGRRFIAISLPGMSTAAGTTDRIVIVQNWVEWLKGEVPVD